MNPRVLLWATAPLVLAAGCSGEVPEAGHTWDPVSAAAYLDQRMAWWMEWPGAARDHETFCVSCHTVLPYALARPVLRGALGESNPSADEEALIANVRKRVRLWNETQPFYSGSEDDSKATESRGTESVLNALTLATFLADTAPRDPGLEDDTRKAFTNMWAEQEPSGPLRGAWQWLHFNLEPWEASGSEYYGAALAALAAGTAPEGHLGDPDVEASVEALRRYLRREYGRQSTANRAMLLLASTRLSGLIGPDEVDALVAEIVGAQNDDGGWSLSSVAFDNWKGWRLFAAVRIWFRWEGVPQERASDGYATGLLTLVLREAGVSRDSAPLRRGMAWLSRNQVRIGDLDGAWRGYSLNARRDPSTGAGLFMSDAATAFAVLALSGDDSGARTTVPVSGPDRGGL